LRLLEEKELLPYRYMGGKAGPPGQNAGGKIFV